MPITPSPYRGMVPRWLEELGAQPPGPAVIEGPAHLHRVLAQASPWLYKLLQRLPQRVKLSPERPGPWTFGDTVPPSGGSPPTIRLLPELLDVSPAYARSTMAHEGVHALRKIRNPQTPGVLPPYTTDRLLSTASRSPRFTPEYLDELLAMYERTGHPRGPGHAAVELFADELTRRGGNPVVRRFSPEYDDLTGLLRRIGAFGQ